MSSFDLRRHLEAWTRYAGDRFGGSWTALPRLVGVGRVALRVRWTGNPEAVEFYWSPVEDPLPVLEAAAFHLIPESLKLELLQGEAMLHLIGQLEASP